MRNATRNLELDSNNHSKMFSLILAPKENIHPES